MKPERLQHLLTVGRGLKVIVVGDVMLDEFVWGRVSRISPEAPVPVVEVQEETQYPGGAANVARNLRAFCSEVHILGVVGRDVAAERLRAILTDEGLCTDLLVEVPGFQTIVKTRIIARHQQVVRVDRESRVKQTAATYDLAAGLLAGVLPSADAIIFEDYGKGLLDQGFKDRVCSLVAARPITVTADPNPKNPLDWSGVSAVKPNRSEAFAEAGLADVPFTGDPVDDPGLREVGKILLARWKVPSLLITLGEQGMVLFSQGSEPYHTPTVAREVYDVSGAGDTAIALFTLALAAGATQEEAAEISNHASGVVVGKLGTATLTPEELAASFLENGHAR